MKKTVHKPSLLIIIFGPTATGKTALASELAGRINGEIISADSMQIYKGFDITSQKPDADICARTPHHLISHIDLSEEFNAGLFAELAGKIIEEIQSRSKVPIVAGGTALYVKCLIDGIFEGPVVPAPVRSKYEKLLAEKGCRHLFELIEARDRKTAATIDRHNPRRLLRALAVMDVAGAKLSDMHRETKGIWDRHQTVFFGLRMDRQKLYQRINSRVDRMCREGLVDEIKNLPGQISQTARQAIGVSEIGEYLDGKISLEKALEQMKQNTRNYAKRQITWFRKDTRIRWIDMDDNFAGKAAAMQDIIEKTHGKIAVNNG